MRTPVAGDEGEFLALRRASWAFLAPWEPEIEGVDPLGPAMFARFLRFGPRHRRQRLLVCRNDDGAMLGAISFSEIERGASAVVGYWIGAAHARRGFMSEALTLALAQAFNALRVERVDAYVLPENGPSKGLLAKLGFRPTGIAPALRVLRGEPRDHERWTLTGPSRVGSESPG